MLVLTHRDDCRAAMCAVANSIPNWGLLGVPPRFPPDFSARSLTTSLSGARGRWTAPTDHIGCRRFEMDGARSRGTFGGWRPR